MNRDGNQSDRRRAADHRPRGTAAGAVRAPSISWLRREPNQSDRVMLASQVVSESLLSVVSFAHPGVPGIQKGRGHE